MKKLLFLFFIFIYSFVYAGDFVDGKKYDEFEIAQFDGISTPSVSPINSARLFYSATQDTLRLSVNHGSYLDILTTATGGSSGSEATTVSDTATVNLTLTGTDITADIIEAGVEGILDLQDLQGAVTDAQVPDNITITETDPLSLKSSSLDTSLKLANLITDETGSGGLVFRNTPSFLTPALGTATADNLTIVTGGKFTIGTTQWNSGDNINVTKISNVTTGKILGRSTAGTGAIEQLTQDGSGACAAGSVCMGGHTHVGVNEVYGAGWNSDTSTPEKDDVYDWGHLFDTDDDGDVDVVDATVWATKQEADADLTDLADGSLTGTKVGFADTDGNFTATDVQSAIEELDNDSGASAPNQADYKVNWNQIGNMPAGFADGVDADSGGSTAWDDIGDPDADTTIALGGYETVLTSTLDEANHIVLKIYNTDADLANDTYLLVLEFTDDADANGIFFDCRDNNGDSKFKIGADGAITSTGTIASADFPAIGNDPDVATAGYIGRDANNHWLRGYDGAIQFIYGQKAKLIDFTATNPDLLTETAFLPIWTNKTGATFVIDAIYSVSDVDDAVYTLKFTTNGYTDHTNLTTIEAITISTNGTGVFYNDLTSGIDSTSIADGATIGFDNGATDCDFIHGVIVGHLLGDVN